MLKGRRVREEEKLMVLLCGWYVSSWWRDSIAIECSYAPLVARAAIDFVVDNMKEEEEEEDREKRRRRKGWNEGSGDGVWCMVYGVWRGQMLKSMIVMSYDGNEQYELRYDSRIRGYLVSLLSLVSLVHLA